MFRLLTYRASGRTPRPGLLVGGTVFDIGDRYGSVLAALNDWEAAEPRLHALAEALRADGSERGTPVENVSLAAPVLYPGALYCAGANYRDHVLEMTGRPPPPENTEPYFFMKSTRGTIIGANETIRLPSYSSCVDWEAEIALVIGREARNVNESEAMSCVAGFTIVNDLSARDRTKRHDVPFLFDWIGQKCFDTACPMGPWITPRSEVKNPHGLRITLSVNGVVKQDSSSSEMIFRCETQIAYLSRHVTLYPGDVIATGTPAGCGMPRKEFLRAGDTVQVQVEGLGRLDNPVAVRI